MSNKFKNVKQIRLKDEITANIKALQDKDFTDRTTFNFSFFDNSGKYGDKIDKWNLNELKSLLEELVTYSKNSLNVWKTKNRGGGAYFTNYSDFPKGSQFKVPSGIPKEAKWGSLRITTKMRILGFRMTGRNDSNFNLRNQENYDDNIFYVVWLDKSHRAFPKQSQGKNKR